MAFVDRDNLRPSLFPSVGVIRYRSSKRDSIHYYVSSFLCVDVFNLPLLYVSLFTTRNATNTLRVTVTPLSL